MSVLAISSIVRSHRGQETLKQAPNTCQSLCSDAGRDWSWSYRVSAEVEIVMELVCTFQLIWPALGRTNT